jgi:6-pyruvoyltetrahydropterin/6-carboxytetrahydropterin synthase
MRVCKQFTFDAAHMLSSHPGQCANLHGHTYKVEVIVTSECIDVKYTNGILVDFADVSKIIKEVIGPFDHAFIYNSRADSDSLEANLVRLLAAADKRTATTGGPPTAENMALYFKHQINPRLPKGIVVGSVKVWETPTAYAETGYGE